MNIRLKMSKIILLFVMVFCLMITFGFVSMNASAMECSEDNHVEISQDEDEHIHSYTFFPKGGKHLRTCSCGERELLMHIIASADCNKDYANCKYCGAKLNLKTDLYYIEFGPESTTVSMLLDEEDLETYSQDSNPHTHIYSYKRISSKQHQLMCTCGKAIGETRNHIINASDAGKHYAECIECKDLLDMTTDMAFVVGEDLEPVPSHEHDFSYERISNKQHQLKCECGAVTGETRNHMINASDAGSRYAKCIECGDLLDLTTDMAFVVGEEETHTHKYTYTPINNSKHTGTCDCGATITGSHKFTQVAEGQQCLQCGYVVKFLIGLGLGCEETCLF